jgi:PBP1b-binding outer membrane lipoprotein LpoB
MQKLALLVLCGGTLLSGCQSSSTAPVEVGKTPDSATAEKPKEPEAPTTAPEPEPAPAANIAEIPEKFKTDAYVYGGLEKLGQQTFSQTITGQEPSEAVVTTTYLGIKDGFPQWALIPSVSQRKALISSACR